MIGTAQRALALAAATLLPAACGGPGPAGDAGCDGACEVSDAGASDAGSPDAQRSADAAEGGVETYRCEVKANLTAISG